VKATKVGSGTLYPSRRLEGQAGLQRWEKTERVRRVGREEILSADGGRANSARAALADLQMARESGMDIVITIALGAIGSYSTSLCGSLDRRHFD